MATPTRDSTVGLTGAQLIPTMMQGGSRPTLVLAGCQLRPARGATADLAVSQRYTMTVAGRGQLVVPGILASLAAPFLTAVHVLISGHVQSPPASGTVA